jgi:hypothetical protein
MRGARCDAEHALIDGWVPPPLHPLRAPPDTPPDDDPELDTYRRSRSGIRCAHHLRQHGRG